jgi:hypothetical protein
MEAGYVDRLRFSILGVQDIGVTARGYTGAMQHVLINHPTPGARELARRTRAARYGAVSCWLGLFGAAAYGWPWLALIFVPLAGNETRLAFGLLLLVLLVWPGMAVGFLAGVVGIVLALISGASWWPTRWGVLGLIGNGVLVMGMAAVQWYSWFGVR